MITVAVVMALAAAAFHGTWNVLVKVSGDPILTFRRVTLTTAAVATIPLLPAWWLLGRPALDPASAGLCLVSSLLETTYLWLLSTAYRRGELSAVYPIARGSAPLLSVVVGLALLGERLATPQLVGVALLLIGILSVTLSQARGRATLPALMTGVAIAAYTSVDRVGVAPLPPARGPATADLEPVDRDRHLLLGGVLPRPVGVEPGAAGRGGAGKGGRHRRRRG